MLLETDLLKIQADCLPVGGALKAVDYSLWVELAVSPVMTVT
jgi:hypothetical protein